MPIVRFSDLLVLFVQENEEAKVAFVQDLKRMLREAPLFSTTSSDQHLYYSLMGFRNQLGEYCISRNITSPVLHLTGDRTIANGGMAHQNSSGSMAASNISMRPDSLSLGPPAPPPPPLPSPTQGSIGASSTGKQESKDSNSILPVGNNGNRAVKQVSFLEEIVHHKKKTLKRTGVPRTPGGTPIRPRGHTYNLTNCSTHGDIIQQALLRKFQRVRLHSTPKKRQGSKLVVIESGSIECSTAWSEYGSEHGGHYASDPDLTRSDGSLWDTDGSNTAWARSAAEIDDPSSPAYESGKNSTVTSPHQMQYSTSI